MDDRPHDGTVRGIASAIRSGRTTAVEVVRQTLDRIARDNPSINAVTRVLSTRALMEADAVDRKLAQGVDPGPLAGVPYGVKDLFDVEGIATTAGSAFLAQSAPAPRDAEAIRRLQAAGAVLVATLNMDEFAYGFVTDNAFHGLTRNPRDPRRFAGGSSGGSAAAVAAGMVPFTLGSDTNGSIRIPAGFCGLYGLKPTHGSLPMAGVFPFVDTLDDIGAIAARAGDLSLVDAILRGDCVDSIWEMRGSFRPARLGGWFGRNLAQRMEAALEGFSAALGDLPVVEIAEVARARSAAFLITAYEGGRLHLEQLRRDPLVFDPATRDRLLAGAALPHELYSAALAFREPFGAALEKLFEKHDILIAPVTYGPAPLIEWPFVMVDGEPQPARANLGAFTQPVSYLGLPVISFPIGSADLPLGIQLIGPKGSDRRLLAFARMLEAREF